jgi:prenylcysteine alpha-carboxyl methylesterase
VNSNVYFLCSETFADVLKHAGGKVKLQLYEGKTHTDVFLQVSYLEGQNISAEVDISPWLIFTYITA